MHYRRRYQSDKPILTLDELRAAAQRLNAEVEQVGRALRADFEATPRVYADIPTLRAYRALLVRCNAIERDLATAEKQAAPTVKSIHRMRLIMD